jgi:hypothetical protein
MSTFRDYYFLDQFVALKDFTDDDLRMIGVNDFIIQTVDEDHGDDHLDRFFLPIVKIYLEGVEVLVILVIIQYVLKYLFQDRQSNLAQELRN